MKYQMMGSTDLRVSRMCLGTWQLSGAWGPEVESVADAVRCALDLGINFFDSGRSYGWGASESGLSHALGEVMRTRRDSLVISTKGGVEGSERDDPTGALWRNSDAARLRGDLEESLQALGTDYVDIYFIHWPDPTVPLAETSETLRGFVQEGLVRYVGVSNFTVAQIEEFSSGGPVDVVQNQHSLVHQTSRQTVFPFSDERGIGKMGYSALAHGLLSGSVKRGEQFDDWRSAFPYFQGASLEATMDLVDQLGAIAGERGCTVAQLALAWAMSDSTPAVPIVGALTPEHVEDSVRAVEIELTADEADRLTVLSASIPPMDIGAAEFIGVRGAAEAERP